jgi:hypothetical protein
MINKRNGYILSIDLLGFEKWIRSDSLDNVLNEYASIITGTSFAAEMFAGNNFDLFVYSDTLVIICNLPNEDECLCNLLKCARLLQHSQFYRGTLDYTLLHPIRGTLTWGEFIYHKGDIRTQALARDPIVAKNIDIFIGMPIIEGYHLEKSLQIMSIVLSGSASRKIGLSKLEILCRNRLLIEYDIPFKSTKKKGYLSTPLADFCHYETILSKLKSEAIINKDDTNTSEKITNTISLLEYVKSIHDTFVP